MGSNYVIELSSNLDFEGMVVDLTFKNQVFMTFNYDKGIENIEMEISLLGPNRPQNLVIPLKEFEEAVRAVKKVLERCCQEDKYTKTD
jgi:hypothetical protein